MAELDVTKKLDVYHALYRLNLSFAAIVRRCGDLQQTRVFRPKFLRLFQGLQIHSLGAVKLLQT
jgi:hypothetical protein